MGELMRCLRRGLLRLRSLFAGPVRGEAMVSGEMPGPGKKPRMKQPAACWEIEMLCFLAMVNGGLGAVVALGLIGYAMAHGLFDFDDATSQAWLILLLVCIGVIALGRLLLDRERQTAEPEVFAGGKP